MSESDGEPEAEGRIEKTEIESILLRRRNRLSQFYYRSDSLFFVKGNLKLPIERRRI